MTDKITPLLALQSAMTDKITPLLALQNRSDSSVKAGELTSLLALQWQVS
jgi:hypothetical protein